MTSLIRFWETLTGTPHQHTTSRDVEIAAGELQAHTEELHRSLKPYVEADDPLVMLLTDVFNQRQLQLGSNNAKPELHS